MRCFEFSSLYYTRRDATWDFCWTITGRRSTKPAYITKSSSCSIELSRTLWVYTLMHSVVTKSSCSTDYAWGFRQTRKYRQTLWPDIRAQWGHSRTVTLQASRTRQTRPAYLYGIRCVKNDERRQTDYSTMIHTGWLWTKVNRQFYTEVNWMTQHEGHTARTVDCFNDATDISSVIALFSSESSYESRTYFSDYYVTASNWHLSQQFLSFIMQRLNSRSPMAAIRRGNQTKLRMRLQMRSNLFLCFNRLNALISWCRQTFRLAHYNAIFMRLCVQKR
jgi:hypothetical protein